jgi:hypothetical protein
VPLTWHLQCAGSADFLSAGDHAQGQAAVPITTVHGRIDHERTRPLITYGSARMNSSTTPWSAARHTRMARFAWRAVGRRLHRILQRPAPRRMPEHRAVLVTGPRPHGDQRLKDRVQPSPQTLSPSATKPQLDTLRSTPTNESRLSQCPDQSIGARHPTAGDDLLKVSPTCVPDDCCLIGSSGGTPFPVSRPTGVEI